MEKKRVLIVDDEETSRQMALFDLSNTFDCDTAVDALDAYSKIWKAIDKGNPYDVITLDEIMPSMDGMALLKILRTNEKHFQFSIDRPLRYVIVSGLESKQHLQKMYKSVMEDRCAYIKKPFDKGVLLETINRLLA